MGLKTVPLTLDMANSYIAAFHRHHKPVRGHRFSIGAMKGDDIIGVAVVSRPVARMCDQYLTAEVTRLCTEGGKNVCSFLYGAAARICKEMGFTKIQTYLLDSEPGTSMKGRPDGSLKR